MDNGKMIPPDCGNKECPRCHKLLPESMFTASLWCDDCYCRVCYDREKE